MNRARFRKNSKGFTLIELMIAITLLIVGLVGVIMVIPLAQRVAGRSALATRSAIFAAEKTEELKAKGYTTLVSQPSWSGAEDDFSWVATIDPVAMSDFANFETLPSSMLVKITMQVTYKSQGKTKTDEFITFVSEL
jgi:prepilin-type N-terminal cleavage/methylation domain-containing protein